MSYGVQIIRNSSSFDEIISLSYDKPVVVDFSAQWCGPCKAISPVFERYSKKYPDIHFAKVDIDKHQKIASEYEVSMVPTFLFFKGGSVVKKIVGVDSERLKRYIRSNSL